MSIHDEQIDEDLTALVKQIAFPEINLQDIGKVRVGENTVDTVNTGDKKIGNNKTFVFGDPDGGNRLKDILDGEDVPNILGSGEDEDIIFDDDTFMEKKLPAQGTYNSSVISTSKYKLFVAPREGEGLKRMCCAPIGQGTSFCLALDCSTKVI